MSEDYKAIVTVTVLFVIGFAVAAYLMGNQ